MSQLKTIQDYYDLICSEYPSIPQRDIKRILLYGWKSFYLHNSYGGDVLINQKGFWFYCGSLMKNSLKWFNYYIRKMIVKLRVMYKRKNIPYDGYYYFALSEKLYNEYLSLKNKRGRPRKNFTFYHVYLYKIYDECNIAENGKVAIFRLPIPMEFGYTLYKDKLITDQAEPVLIKDPYKFLDILLTNYNYQFLADNSCKYKKEKNGEHNINS